MSHERGNYPENFTPKMYWGARAILERDSYRLGKALYLLPDRQSFERLDGSQRGQDAFFDWINTKVLSELRRLARENRFYEWNDLVTVQSEDVAFMCQATPKGSYGGISLHRLLGDRAGVHDNKDSAEVTASTGPYAQ